MSSNMDFICAASPSSFSSAVAIQEVRVGGLGLRTSEQLHLGGGGGGGGGGEELIGPTKEEIGTEANRSSEISAGFYGSKVSDGWKVGERL
jgi:hypothetical protein